ncbi:MAG: hypothetical protein HQ511_11715 [Rhodospirillales bacterium]|nr:hypothetical protein [Rhodospirillales bacterium]
MLSRTLGTLGKYLIVFAVVVAAANLFAYNGWQARERERLNLLSKRDAYLAAPETYGIVFFGDSRTFCAFHPDLLEAPLGARGYNLSFWANWLPTQFAYIEDIAPHIPPGTVFVWSLGHVNFTEGKIRPVYPIGWPRLFTMISLGFEFADLRENLFAYTPVLWTFGYRDRIMEEIDTRLGRPLVSPRVETSASLDDGVARQIDDLVARHGGAGGVADTETYRDGTNLASVALYKTNGAYLRVETNPEYYRALQRETAITVRAEQAGKGGQEFQADPRYWALFQKALDVLQRNGVRVVLNEIEEAPHHYPSPQARDAARSFMRDVVQAEAERRGIPYVRADFDRLKDADYFDYNHLNSVGVAKYTDMIAPLLKPYVNAAD